MSLAIRNYRGTSEARASTFQRASRRVESRTSAHLGVLALQHLLVQSIQLDSDPITLLFAPMLDNLRDPTERTSVFPRSNDIPMTATMTMTTTYRLQNPSTLVPTSDLPHTTLDGLVQLLDLLAPFFLGKVGSSCVFPEGQQGILEQRVRGE